MTIGQSEKAMFVVPTSAVPAQFKLFELIGSDYYLNFLDGMSVPEAKEEIATRMEKMGIGERKVNFRLRDWGVSRQRYFGVPIPVWYPVLPSGQADHEHPIYPTRKQLPVDPLSDAPHGFTEEQRGKRGGTRARAGTSCWRFHSSSCCLYFTAITTSTRLMCAWPARRRD